MAVEELRFGDGPLEVAVLPGVGARLHRLRAFGHDILDAPDDPAAHARDPFFGGAYVMAPWCNRLAAGPVRVGSTEVALAANFPDGSAIHGQVYARPWERQADGTLRVQGGGDGWPWAYEVGLAVEVVDRSLRLDLYLANRSPEAMPAGLGLHPWFRRPDLVAIRAEEVFTSNTASPPLPVPVWGPFDLRRLGPMAPDLDATWSDLGEPPVELRWSRIGVGATMRASAPTRYIVAASPLTHDGVAIEPETHAPQGLRRLLAGEPGGLAWLEPGATLALRVELDFERLGER